MKKAGVLIFVAALGLGLVMANVFSFGRVGAKIFNLSINFGAVCGSGELATDNRSISGFRSVETGGIFQVEITAQKEFGVVVEADDNLLPLIRTEVRGGVLHIESEKRIKSNNPIRVRVSAPDIEKLDVSGVANVSLDNIKNAALAIDSSGASKIRVTGETSKLTVDISGATKVNAEELKAANADIGASGASFVSVNVSSDLRANASGASRVIYAGNPTNVTPKRSGAASVSAR